MSLKSIPLIAAVAVLSGCGSHYDLHFNGRIDGTCVIFNERKQVTENNATKPGIKLENQSYLSVQIGSEKVKTFWDNNGDLKVDYITVRNADAIIQSYAAGVLQQQEFESYLRKIQFENQRSVPIITYIYDSYQLIGCPPDPYQ